MGGAAVRPSLPADPAFWTAFSGSGRRPAAQDELSQLRRENARLQEENAILKKAAAYFARELK